MIALLASVTLFALVVTSRPILPADPAPTSSTLQTTLQAAFHILPGKDDLKFDAARFQFRTPKQQIEGLSANVDDGATIASFEMLPGVTSVLETPGDDTGDADGTSATNDAGVSATAPLLVLTFSCVAAFLALACIALTLYIIKALRSQMLASKTAWDLLPHFWRRSSSRGGPCASAEKHLVYGTDSLLGAEEGSTDMQAEDKPPLYFDAVSDVESESDDVDDKYQDALDTTPLPRVHQLPLEENVFDPSHVDDPPLPTTGSCPLDQPTGNRSTPLMRECCSSPVSRPAWSVRAIDAPALGLSAGEGNGVTSTPQPLLHPRRRAYRSVVPELDIALAMQLRPGLGMGADSAWMVRFLMTIFGWFAVALTGGTR